LHELQSLTDFHRQTVETAARQRLEDDPVHQRWCAAKRITWMILLTVAFLFFYLIHKMHEAVTLL
jgi:hypothetical protein